MTAIPVLNEFLRSTRGRKVDESDAAIMRDFAPILEEVAAQCLPPTVAAFTVERPIIRYDVRLTDRRHRAHKDGTCRCGKPAVWMDKPTRRNRHYSYWPPTLYCDAHAYHQWVGRARRIVRALCHEEEFRLARDGIRIVRVEAGWMVSTDDGMARVNEWGCLARTWVEAFSVAYELAGH